MLSFPQTTVIFHKLPTSEPGLNRLAGIPMFAVLKEKLKNNKQQNATIDSINGTGSSTCSMGDRQGVGGPARKERSKKVDNVD
ncbi:hypothetical protein SAMN05216436_108114 [bacterium A37T11]|nr:hypothetical protein SAMN05216436_108114 [bacterium A37T11]